MSEKTPFEIASKHIPEARVSMLSRAIRQGLNDYGWKNFGTIPEVLAGYVIDAEKAEAATHQPPECELDVARDWLRKRWAVQHPNEGHVEMLAEYAASLPRAVQPLQFLNTEDGEFNGNSQPED